MKVNAPSVTRICAALAMRAPGWAPLKPPGIFAITQPSQPAHESQSHAQSPQSQSHEQSTQPQSDAQSTQPARQPPLPLPVRICERTSRISWLRLHPPRFMVTRTVNTALIQNRVRLSVIFEASGRAGSLVVNDSSRTNPRGRPDLSDASFGRARGVHRPRPVLERAPARTCPSGEGATVSRESGYQRCREKIHRVVYDLFATLFILVGPCRTLSVKAEVVAWLRERDSALRRR
jgi:hypothetical protein